MTVRRGVLAVVVAALLMAAGGAKAAAPDTGMASRFIEKLATEAIAVLQKKDISLAEREAEFQGLLSNGFDLHFIGKFALGRKYRRATPSQRESYHILFAKFVLKTYSSRLGGYAGEKFRVLSAGLVGKKDVMVETRIERKSGPPIKAGWRVRLIDGRPRIIDVMVEGVSMAITQRQEFAAVVRNGGIDGLLNALSARTEKLSVTASN